MQEEIIKRKIKKLKRKYPTISEEQIEKELFPLKPQEFLKPKIWKKKRRLM